MSGQNPGIPKPGTGADADVSSPPFLPCSDWEVQRWNKEWLGYLAREFQEQLTPHTERVEKPALPADPAAMITFKVGKSPPLSLYCDADRIEGKRLMELGCGCGNLGKYLGRYCESYLGTDYSTLALKVARLVSPENCHYVHVSDHAALAAHFGTIDTIVGRYFWIHQNMALAGRVLRFMAPFLARDGRIYADFCWPNPEKKQGVVLSPHDELSERFASATFAYSRKDVEKLVENTPFRVVREFIHLDTQRRYIVLEKLN